MGFIKAAVGAVGGMLADSWRDYFYCDALAGDVLMAKGRKRAGKRSSNTKGDDNVISNGSVVVVNQGQCAIIVQQGLVVEICAEPGELVWEASAEPSILYGDLSSSVQASFERLARRLQFGGEPGVDQRVYYFNTKEITDNKFGTANPVPFRVVDANIGLDVDIAIRCHGVYSYRVEDPILFYSQVAGNVADEYRRQTLDPQLKAELLAALQPALARVSQQGIRYSALPGHAPELQQALNEVLSQQWIAARGIRLASLAISSATASPEDEAMIKQLQAAAVMRDPTLAAANLVAAQSDAMRLAAANQAGAMTGFAGLGMAQATGGVSAQDLFALGQTARAAGGSAPAPGATAAPAPAVAVPGATAVPDPEQWVCPDCGAANRGQFCTNCGRPKPAPTICPKCGWRPTGPGPAPRFCANCGAPMDADQPAA
ncbi:MAG: SPFH domain-containing protein [Propionibacteriaceae bacterium]|jgi:membrane protease subunit (stomatin/prohibitin family)|nr:SPFH domain-containing protein [Propionibacteriaceae bacterium]